VGDLMIQELSITYAAVATDLESGLPYPITKGSLARAIRASISVPGLLTPVWIDGHLLIDGGVSDPVPVDVARQLGADVVVAVDVLVNPEEIKLSGIPVPEYRERILGIIRRMETASAAVLFQMSTVFQKRVSDLSLQIHPPDVLIQPDFSSDPPCYSDVKNGIEAGEEAACRVLPEILSALTRG
jgi:NTE family protein